MSSKRKSLIPILLLVMIVCVVGVVYLATFHKEDMQVVVRDFVTRSLGDHVVIEHIQVGFFPFPHLELRDVSIQDPEQGTPVFQATYIQLDLNFLSFVQDIPMPHALIIEHAVFDLKRDENGQWNYQNIFQKESSDQVEIGAWLLGRSLKLTNGTVHLGDRYRRESAFIIHAEDVELQVEQLVWDGPTEMFLSARFSEGDTRSVLSAYGTLQDIGGFLKEGTTIGRDASPQFDLHTRMDLDRRTLVQLADLLDVHEVPIGLQGRTKVQGHLHFAPGIAGYDLSVSDLVVLTDSVDLNSDINVKGLWRPEPFTFSGQWSSAPVAIQHLPQLLPEGLIPSELSDAIHRQSISGKIQAVSATFTGSSRKEAGHTLTGKFQLSEARLNLGPQLGTVKEMTCTINVGADEIRFFDLRGQYEELPVTQGQGTIVFAEQGPWLTTEFGGRVSAPKIIGLMQTIAGWSLSQRPEEALQGKAGSGLLTMRFAGPLKDPQAIAFQSAEYHAERIAMQLPGLR
ncbi:MAG: AsmA family protein, partial [Nitrospira sp. SB0672_bin_25]|nr:AsmA family protein [Nitrospira sp. SB0672_bin_25]